MTNSLSVVEKNFILNYLKTTFWDNSPAFLFSDKKGRVWKLNHDQVPNGFVTINNGTYNYVFDKSQNRYDTIAAGFRGWYIDSNHSIWNVTERDILNTNGYDKERSKQTPNKDDNDEFNYNSKSDYSNFQNIDKNMLRKIPYVLGGMSKPNYIAGYSRLSSNENYDASGNSNFPAGGFLIMNRSGNNQAFVIYAKYQNKDTFANSIFVNHPEIVSKIINEVYYTESRDCIAIENDIENNIYFHGNQIKNIDNDCLKSNFEISYCKPNISENQLWNKENDKIFKMDSQGYKTNRCLRLNSGTNFQGQSTNFLYGTLDSCKAASTTSNNNEWLFENNLIKLKSLENKCLDSDGNNIYPSNCDTNNPFQQWDTSGEQIKHINSNKCLQLDDKSGQVELKECQNFNEFSWILEKENIKNIKNNKCLDSDGNNIYYGECNDKNQYQQWKVEKNKIIHRPSQKCLRIKNNKLELIYCSCTMKLKNDSSRVKYYSHIDKNYNHCYNKNRDWCYDNIENCDDLLYTNKDISNNFLNWCINNRNNSSIIKSYCDRKIYMDPSYYYRLRKVYCNKNNNLINDRPTCDYDIKVRKFSLRNNSDIEENLYSKQLYENILDNSCRARKNYISGNNQIKWKYTNNANDSECLNNWNYYEKDGKTLIEENIENITKAKDTKFWCATKNENLEILCNNKENTLNRIDKTSYNNLNNIWKNNKCYGDIPHILYLYLFNKNNNEQTKFINDLKESKTYFARNLCFSGESLEIDEILLPAQALYSDNNKYEFKLHLNGELRINNLEDDTSVLLNDSKITEYKDLNNSCRSWAESGECKNNQGYMLSNCSNSCKEIIQSNYLIMQSDGNLVLYNAYSQATWSSGTSHDGSKQIFLVMRNDGKLVLYGKNGDIIKILNQSNFDNKLENSDESENNCFNMNIEIALYLLLFISFIILFYAVTHITKKNKKNNTK